MTIAETARRKFPLKTLLSFLGPGFLVTVGFIDPGNWATNIEGGSRFGYGLLWVITLGTLMLIVIQHLHPNVIHSRKWGLSDSEKKNCLRYEKIGTLLAMSMGWIVNSAMSPAAGPADPSP
jgi:NRAMP (natural resistance-associated macrophage protein)-like metal ion transporter